MPLKKKTKLNRNRSEVVKALKALDEEAFNGLVVGTILAWTQRAGGYADKDGIARVRELVEQRVAIAMEAE